MIGAGLALKAIPATWWAGIAVMLLAAIGMQTMRLAGEQADHARTVADLARLRSQVDQQAKADAQANTVGLALHSRLQQDNTHGFTTYLLGLARAETAGVARRHADAAGSQRLRNELQLLATGKAQSDAELAACRDLGDQYGKLVSLVERGVESIGQLRTVVGRGIEVVSRRDAEVSALRGQVEADRAALAVGE